MRSTRKILAIMLALALAAPSLFASRIDLGSGVYYLRKGFDPGALTETPSTVGGVWTAFRRYPGQRISVQDFGLPSARRPGILDFAIAPPADFTLVRIFDATQELIDTPGLSVIVPQVGQGWALYLNGDLIHDELLRTGKGQLSPQRTLRDTVVSLDRRSLRPGANILAFHIVGDPGDELTGLSSGRSLVIDTHANLSRQSLEYVDIVLIGIYALFALYHVILFALRPKAKAYLAYALAAFFFSAFVFARTQAAASALHDTALLLDLEDGSLFLSLPLFMAFIEMALGKRVSAVTKAGFLVSAGLVALLPFFRHAPVRTLWEVVSVLQLANIFAVRLVPALVSRARTPAGSSSRSGLGGFLGSDEFLLFLSTLVFAGAAVGDIFVVAAGLEPFLSKYAFLVFVIGSGAILAGQFTGVYGQLERLGASLERKVAERSAEIALSIERQRSLGEEIAQKTRRLADAADANARDLDIAARVQRGFFADQAPKVEGWDLALAWRPAAKVSGDFYDFYLEEGRLEGLALGDVSGHGIGAGLVAVLARSVFGRRWFDNRRLPLGELLALIHADLEGEIGAVDEYLTALLLRIDGDKVEYANAAHPDLLYRRASADRAVAILPKGQADFRGPVLGKSGLGGSWTSIRFAPGPGDLLLASTDCLEEAKNPSGEPYGRERLLASLVAAGSGSAAEILENIITDVENFRASSTFDDDLTAILLKRL